MTKKEAAELTPLVAELKTNLDQLTEGTFPAQKKIVKRSQAIADQIAAILPEPEPTQEQEGQEEQEEQVDEKPDQDQD